MDDCDWTAAMFRLTLVAAVLKLGVVVILVADEHGDLTDPDERLLGLIRGRHRQRELPLTLPVEARRGGDRAWNQSEVTMLFSFLKNKQSEKDRNPPESGSMSKPDDTPSLCMMPYLTSPLTPMSAS